MTRTLNELREVRVTAGLSQAAVGRELGLSQASYWRLEAGQVGEVTVQRMAELASVLGLELALNVYPIGDPIRDTGQQAIGRRFEALLDPAWRVTSETLLPGQGELRAWDKLLRLVGEQPRHLVGVDIESRIRDVQGLVRRTRLRERDGHVDAILIVLADSAANRRLVGELRATLGGDYATASRVIRAALRQGARLPGSGVALV